MTFSQSCGMLKELREENSCLSAIISQNKIKTEYKLGMMTYGKGQ